MDSNIFIYNWNHAGIEASTTGNGLGVGEGDHEQPDSGLGWRAVKSGGDESIVERARKAPSSITATPTSPAAEFVANKIANVRLSLANWKTATGETDATYQALTYPDATRDLER